MTLLDLIELRGADFPEANFMRGFLHFNGLGVAKNMQLAVLLYKRAAEQGLACAHYAVGRIYLEGKHVERGPDLGVKHLRAAPSNHTSQPSVCCSLRCLLSTKRGKTQLPRRPTMPWSGVEPQLV